MLSYYCYVRQDGDNFTFSERFKEGYETRILSSWEIRKFSLKMLKTFALFCEDKMNTASRPTVKKYEEIFEFVQEEIKRRECNGVLE